MIKGQRLIKIDWKEVDKYLEAGCSGIQIAATLGCHKDTLYSRCIQEHSCSFADYSARKKAKGDSMLHYEQFKLAMKGDRSMLIWLGKQRLDQKEDPNAGKNAVIQTFTELKKAAAEGSLKDLLSQDE
jgi:IS30 family transposase